MILALGLLLAGCQDFDLPTDAGPPPQRAAFSLGGVSATPGELVAWGFDDYKQVPTGSDFVAVASGFFHNVALRSDGTLAAWLAWDIVASGDASGQVSGTPTTGGFVAIAAGDSHNLALRSDGTLVSWGSDFHSQVSGTPSGNGFVAIDAREHHSLALRSDGTLVSWGHDGFGQVSGTPTGGGFVAIAAGGYHSLALRSDGTLVSWGLDHAGQVSGTPTGSGFVAIDAGRHHNVALRSDGVLVSWGSNQFGQVSGTPTGDLATFAAGVSFNVAVRSDGTLVSWGNNFGLVVSGLPAGGGFTAVAGGGGHALAIRTPPASTPTFGGIQPPVSASVINVVSAGRTVPINFSLGGDFGLDVFEDGYPQETQVACVASATSSTFSATAARVRESRLTYADGQYTYLWVTNKAWAGSCRQLKLAFRGAAGEVVLDFEFRP